MPRSKIFRFLDRQSFQLKFSLNIFQVSSRFHVQQVVVLMGSRGKHYLHLFIHRTAVAFVQCCNQVLQIGWLKVNERMDERIKKMFQKKMVVILGVALLQFIPHDSILVLFYQLRFCAAFLCAFQPLRIQAPSVISPPKTADKLYKPTANKQKFTVSSNIPASQKGVFKLTLRLYFYNALCHGIVRPKKLRRFYNAIEHSRYPIRRCILCDGPYTIYSVYCPVVPVLY